ncbi:hypothetical protein KKA85_07840 [bacterium]|nr:hypothetical protein [bacterium]
MPVIPERNMELTLTLGFWQINQEILAADGIIYKYTDKTTYFGDVSLSGQAAFHPQLRLNYNLLPWFSLEPVVGFSVSEYRARIANALSLSNQAFGEEENLPMPVDEIGEFDAENRSCITLSTGMNAVFYPRDYGNFGKGRWHPYLQGGAHHTWMTLNSDYTDAPAKMWDLSGGVGMRIIADDLISVRMEVMYHHMTVDFEPGRAFAVRDEGNTRIPVTRWVEGEGQVSVADYDAHTLDTFSWAVGFTADF